MLPWNGDGSGASTSPPAAVSGANLPGVAAFWRVARSSRATVGTTFFRDFLFGGIVDDDVDAESDLCVFGVCCHPVLTLVSTRSVNPNSNASRRIITGCDRLLEGHI